MNDSNWTKLSKKLSIAGEKSVWHHLLDDLLQSDESRASTPSVCHV